MEPKAIFYFTGTGNSLAAARRLARALALPPPVPMVAYMGYDVVRTRSEVVGLVYPVHHWGPPDLVLRFARKLKVPRGTYVFAVATYGGHSGRAFQGLSAAMDEHSNGLSAGYHVKTVQNYVPVFFMAGEDTVKRLQREADAQVDLIVEAVGRRGKGEREHWWYRPDVPAYYKASKRGLHSKDDGFEATSACNSCGVCARVCPVANIEMQEGRPAWLHRCEQCFACLHWCPEGAIEWGGSTRGRGRYHHPSVRVVDMEAQAGRG